MNNKEITQIYFYKEKYLKLQDSYKKALDYTKTLKREKRELGKDLKDRTWLARENFKRLEDSYQKLSKFKMIETEVDTIYKAATIGNITQPLIHDIASPLSALEAAFILLKRSDLSEKERELIISQGEDSIKNALKVLESARKLMKNKKEIVQIDLKTSIHEVTSILNDLLQKNEIKLIVKTRESIIIDSLTGILERVITNLLINSIEELVESKKPDKEISIKTTTKDNFCIIKIRDNGRGISKEVITKIFEKDFSLKTDHNLGLGLAFVKNTIEKELHGKIIVRSKAQEFTEFEIRLPL